MSKSCVVKKNKSLRPNVRKSGNKAYERMMNVAPNTDNTLSDRQTDKLVFFCFFVFFFFFLFLFLFVANQTACTNTLTMNPMPILPNTVDVCRASLKQTNKQTNVANRTTKNKKQKRPEKTRS